ncbi:MAG TPA: STAS domain-containing protein [Solirubrobacteraceae bacterium]|nr:STAS domain-containing protein [Solirubrobacteraceae bacterium]
MSDTPSEQSSLDTRGIRPPTVYAIDAASTPEGVVVLGMDGEFDLAAAPAIREQLAAARAGGPRGVVVDMTEVTFLDSSALRELLRADAALRADGAPLVLAGLRPCVARMLELTRTTGLLTVAPTVAEALRRAAV